jgi:hypothetical protein
MLKTRLVKVTQILSRLIITNESHLFVIEDESV